MAELSARYAAALYELSQERGMTDDYLSQVSFLRDVLKDSDCRGIIGGSHISAGSKRDFLETTFKGKIHDDLLGFLHLAVAKNRTSFLAPALDEFIQMVHEHNGRTKARVVSARKLSADQLTSLVNLLSEKTGKTVEISARVDPSVLGGFYVYVDGCFFDRTVKKQLRDMKSSIKRSASDDSKA